MGISSSSLCRALLLGNSPSFYSSPTAYTPRNARRQKPARYLRPYRIGFGKTRYWGRSPASTRPVDARAGSVHTDMRSKLRSIDRTILGRSPNGPLELRLSAVGPIRGLVFGAFGEISEEARTLLCYAADATAARTWVADGATSEEHAAALLKNRLYRRWGIKTAREYARIKKIDRPEPRILAAI